MVEYRLTEAEENFADIIWSNEPIRSPELVKICEKKFNWKKSTTYTMLKRLEEKKIFRNKNSIVEALIKRMIFMQNRAKYSLKKILTVLLPDFSSIYEEEKLKKKLKNYRN